MRDENAIEVRNLTKTYKVYLDKGSQLKEKLLFSKRRRYEERQVLRGINFDVKKGEAIGLIGHNGCGKSTTLKLLSKIIYPDSGTIEMRGRVSSLIELGAGFHPDMSGRENIYTNASIFGLSKKEIDGRLDDIIAFSELEEYIDNPVRTYSSGMYMRLAFSVAINVDADILLIDEILAVGDVAFQAKCFNRLREAKAFGTTIVIVSHTMSQIEQFCDRCIWLQSGEIYKEEIPRGVVPKYLEFMSQKLNNGTNDKTEKEKDEEAEKNEGEKRRQHIGDVEVNQVKSYDTVGRERQWFRNDESIIIDIEYTTEKKIDDAVVGIAIYRDDQTYIYGTNTQIDSLPALEMANNGHVRFIIDKLLLNAGKYSFDIAFHRPDGFDYVFIKDACEIEIKSSKSEVGIISIQHQWEL